MKKILFLSLFTALVFSASAQKATPQWPSVTNETKPWTRWWWMGNTLTKEGITHELETFQKAGLGGVEITPIYGVYGYESKFVDFLSPEWMELLMHTLREADRLGLGVDMATGTGWPFGGPWVTEKDASKNFRYKKYELKSGEALKEKIEFTQEPLLRAIGTNLGQIKNSSPDFVGVDARKIDIKLLHEPIGENKNLQSLAVDQIQFERKLKLQVLIAYSDTGEILNLTDKVTSSDDLNWRPDHGSWKLYAMFEGWHGKMVERAGPGGEGFAIDHFSKEALQNYLAKFDEAFRGKNINSLRAFFNDSYEVDDARGAADWTPALFDEFKKRRGYDLRDHLPTLLDEGDTEKYERILSDYRETISELLLTNFTASWKDWAHKRNVIVRNQAHGSPANILDLYAIVDIPEIEGIEPLRIKMASSAGNVTGKKLISSESATWLNEHFESNLSDVKIALDRFMLNGVNHIFYHGTAYSPPDEPWPGWLFYAAVHFNDRNPFWKDLNALNKYVERCQSFLQNTSSDNEVLLYYPIYDAFATRGPKTLQHFDGIEVQFKGTSFEKTAEALFNQGYGFDYISDAQLKNLSIADGELVTEGKSKYKVVVVPKCKYMPLATLDKINKLAQGGATIVFVNELPSSFSGFGDYDNSKKKFDNLKKSIQQQNNVHIFSDEPGELRLPQIGKETLKEKKLSFIRRKQTNGTKLYFISNTSDKKFEGWATLQSVGKSIVLYDPMTGEFGKVKLKNMDSKSEIYLQLEVGQSILLQFYNEEQNIADYFYSSEDMATPIEGEWRLQFISGGPELPKSVKTKSLVSWTMFGDSSYHNFSGTCSYQINFQKPKTSTKTYLLDLGSVKESASVILNGEYIGTLIGPVYQIKIDGALLKQRNILEVQVSNSMANRIAYMDRNNIVWKKFYNVNVAARKAENRVNGIFDASKWRPRESGLLGPVRLISLKSLF